MGEQVELMTLKEVAKRLRVSPSSLRSQILYGPAENARRSGDVRLIKQVHVGSKRMFLKSSVEEFLQRQIHEDYGEAEDGV